MQDTQSFFLPELTILDFTFCLGEFKEPFSFKRTKSIAVKGGLPLSLHTAEARHEKQELSSSNKYQTKNGVVSSAVY